MNIQKYQIQIINKEFLKKHISSFIDILTDVAGEYWDENNFLYELPGKWNYSIAALNHEKQIIGYIIASVKSNSIHIHKYMVHTSFRNQGLGGVLLDYFLELCRNSNFTIITLKVQSNNFKAINFYKQALFEIINSTESYLLMQREI